MEKNNWESQMWTSHINLQGQRLSVVRLRQVIFFCNGCQKAIVVELKFWAKHNFSLLPWFISECKVGFWSSSSGSDLWVKLEKIKTNVLGDFLWTSKMIEMGIVFIYFDGVRIRREKENWVVSRRNRGKLAVRSERVRRIMIFSGSSRRL